jgi:hypothetical protein
LLDRSRTPGRPSPLRPRLSTAIERDRTGSRSERLLEVGEQVVGVLDADREAQQVGGPGTLAFDRGAVFDQAFDAAERSRALPESGEQVGSDG